MSAAVGFRRFSNSQLYELILFTVSYAMRVAIDPAT